MRAKKPFHCRLCEAQFIRKASLNTHIAHIHEGKPKPSANANHPLKQPQPPQPQLPLPHPQFQLHKL